MKIQKLIQDIAQKLGPPKQRAAFGQWTAAAWAVRGIVERGYGISEAVREVLAATGQAENAQAFGSLRAAFYKCRDDEWPAELSVAAEKKAKKETTTVEFE